MLSVTPVHIEWDKARCSSCMACMVVCSERHTGTSAPSRAHIRVLVDLLANHDVSAYYCRQCVGPDGAPAPCAAVCPEEAIAFDASVRAWMVDEEKCLVCGSCVDECPYEAIVIDSILDVASKCDLCKGTPRCVEICAPRALTLVGQEA